jgi:tetratricopeptide (TPR) repeat protein
MSQGTHDDEEEEETGRTLSDSEYARALTNRNDVFLVDKEQGFRSVEAIAIVIGVVFGAHLSTMHETKVASDFFRHIPELRTAKLMRGREPPATPEAKEVGETGGEKQNEVRRIDFNRLAANQSATRFNPPSGVRLNAQAREHETPPRSKAAVIPKTASGNASPQHITPSFDSTASNPRTQLDAREGLADEESTHVIRGSSFKVQDHAKAMAEFRQALKINPHNARALAGIGDIFLYVGLLDSAGLMYRAALAIDPRNAGVHNSLGSVHYYSSDLAANPRYTDFMKIPNPAHYIKSQYDSAMVEYTNAISLDSTCVEALTNRAVTRELHKDFRGAIEDYTLAIRINPSYADAYSKRAATYKSLGRFNEAIDDYTAAIARGTSSYPYDPILHFANAYFGRGIVHYQKGQLDKAIADYDSTLVLSPRHPLAIINKALALGDLMQYDSAIVWYTQAIALISPMEYGGAQEHAYFGRGLMYNQTGRFELALKDFNDALRLKPDDRYAHLHRGNAYKALGKYDSAIADYENATESQRLAAKSCWRIAECCSLKQDRVGALAWLKKAVSYGFRDFAVWKKDNDLSILWNNREFTGLTGQKR